MLCWKILLFHLVFNAYVVQGNGLDKTINPHHVRCKPHEKAAANKDSRVTLLN